MTAGEPRPRLAGKARLRYDRKGERFMLLFPERGLVLNQTAADVLQLCTGEHTVGVIVDRLVEKYATRPREEVERQVTEFLRTMADRGLVLDAAADLQS
jgi:coenzyme PQQ biosynthesis protein PqqD